jgi:hypothetical protein
MKRLMHSRRQADCLHHLGYPDPLDVDREEDGIMIFKRRRIQSAGPTVETKEPCKLPQVLFSRPPWACRSIGSSR